MYYIMWSIPVIIAGSLQTVTYARPKTPKIIFSFKPGEIRFPETVLICYNSCASKALDQRLLKNL